ncbi:MAG TPA: PAS domain S-box protein [candidate division Zixibacteria bacterium]|nr:PAS domain S-box protein [candidate division Zixibacteria bacterium]
MTVATDKKIADKTHRIESQTEPDRRGMHDLLDVFTSEFPLGTDRPVTAKQNRTKPTASGSRLVMKRNESGVKRPGRVEALLNFNRCASQSLHEIYQQALAVAVESTDSQVGFIAVLNKRGTEIDIPAWIHPSESESLIGNRQLVCSLMSADFWADPLECCKPVMVNDHTDADLLKRHYPGDHHPIERHLGVPLILDDRPVAMIGVANKGSDYDRSDTEFLKELVADLWRITERFQVTDALRESEKRYRLLVETMSEGMAAFDENCRVTFVNRCFCEMLGYTPPQLIGNSITEFMDAPGQSVYYEKIAQGKEGGLHPYEVEWRTRTGEPLPAIVSPQPIFDSNGNFIGSFAVVTDITEQKRTEAVLTDTNEALATERLALTEKNVALKEVLSQIEQEIDRVKSQIKTNIDRVVMPLVRKLHDRVDSTQTKYVTLLENFLTEIASPFMNTVERRYNNLSPRELEICNLIRSGLSSKEIASMLNTSIHTVHNQRKQIRKKLGLLKQSDNLPTYLRSIQDRS